MNQFIGSAKESHGLPRGVGQKWEALKGSGEERTAPVSKWKQRYRLCSLVCLFGKGVEGEWEVFDQRDKKTQEIRQKGAVIFNYLKNIPEVIAVCVLIIYCFGRRSSTWRI